MLSFFYTLIIASIPPKPMLISPKNDSEAFVQLKSNKLVISEIPSEIKFEKIYSLYRMNVDKTPMCPKTSGNSIKKCDNMNDKGDKYQLLSEGNFYKIRTSYKLEYTDEPKCLEASDDDLKLEKCKNTDKQLFNIRERNPENLSDDTKKKIVASLNTLPAQQKMKPKPKVRHVMVCQDKSKCKNTGYFELPYIDGY